MRGFASHSSNRWLKRHVSDQFVKEATEKSLRSRSHFKLTEIQEKYRLIRPDSYVVDLGAAPGGWSIAVSKILGRSGKLVAVDLLPMDPIPSVMFIQGDFTSEIVQNQIISQFTRKVDVVLSDMLQNTTGQHDVDHYRSIDLCRTAVEFSMQVLGPQGALLCKYLRGSDEKEFIESLKAKFKTVNVVKPKASRSESSEVYVLAVGQKTSIST